jgi:L-arabinose isomerase
VFNTPPGAGLNASLIDMGNRFRLLVNEVEVVDPNEPMPKLPVAQAMWVPKPDFETACACWIHAGGAHHTGFSQALTREHLEDFAAIADVEFLLIGEGASVFEFKKELRWNEVYHALNRGWAV